MTTRTNALVLCATFLIALAGFVGARDQETCSAWSRSYDGVQYRLCRSSEAVDYDDQLQWHNGNGSKVTISWTWSFGDAKGPSAISLGPSETSDPAAIPKGYRILTVKVERK